MKNKYYMFCRVCLGDKVKVHFFFLFVNNLISKRNKVLYTLASQEFTIDCAPPKWSAIPLQRLYNFTQYSMALRSYILNLNQFRFISALFKRKDGRGDGVKTHETFKCSYPIQSVGLDLHVNFLEFKSCVWSSNYLQENAIFIYRCYVIQGHCC